MRTMLVLAMTVAVGACDEPGDGTTEPTPTTGPEGCQRAQDAWCDWQLECSGLSVDLCLTYTPQFCDEYGLAWDWSECIALTTAGDCYQTGDDWKADQDRLYKLCDYVEANDPD